MSFCLVLLILLCPASLMAEAGRLQDPLRPAYYQAPQTDSTAAGPSAETTPKNWLLSTVLTSKQRSVAVINGQSLVLGEWVEGYKLIKIEPTKVLLQKNKQQIVLRRAGSGLKKTSVTEGVVKGSRQ